MLALLWVLDAVGICLVGTGELHNLLCNRLFFLFLSLVVIGCRHYLRSGARNCCKVVKISQRKGHVPGICQSLSLDTCRPHGASNHSYIFVRSPETNLHQRLIVCFADVHGQCVLSLKQCSNLHPARLLGFIFACIVLFWLCLENLP